MICQKRLILAVLLTGVFCILSIPEISAQRGDSSPYYSKSLKKVRYSTTLPELEQYARRPSQRDQFYNIAFLVVIIGGGACLLLIALGGAEFWRSGLRSLLGMYFAIWIAYGIWLLGLLFGLPYGLSRFKVISIFLGTTALLLVLRELFAFIGEHLRPIEKGYKRCPHCNAVIVLLATECFVCKRKV